MGKIVLNGKQIEDLHRLNVREFSKKYSVSEPIVKRLRKEHNVFRKVTHTRNFPWNDEQISDLYILKDSEFQLKYSIGLHAIERKRRELGIGKKTRGPKLVRIYNGCGEAISKECSKCHRILEYEKFYNKRNMLDGKDSVCIDCCKLRNRTERMRAYNRVKSSIRNEKLSYRIRSNLSAAIKRVVRGCVSKSLENMLGIDWESFKVYFESKFQPGMNWENYGQWHVDHIIPVSSFTEASAHLMNHYTNLQPLWAEDNIRKGNKVI